jgi:hypothetical protein
MVGAFGQYRFPLRVKSYKMLGGIFQRRPFSIFRVIYLRLEGERGEEQTTRSESYKMLRGTFQRRRFWGLFICVLKERSRGLGQFSSNT